MMKKYGTVMVDVEDDDYPEEDAFSYPPELKNKSEFYESVPLFLSENYKALYLESKNKMEGALSSLDVAKLKEATDGGNRKGNAKLYRNKWMQDKLQQQIDKKRKTKKGVLQEKKVEGENSGQAVGRARKGKKGAKGDGGLDAQDLEEIIELCDRIAVMFKGEFMGILDSNDPRMTDIGMMMAGSLRL